MSSLLHRKAKKRGKETQAGELSLSSSGDPAIWRIFSIQTGNFASPPRDGFALVRWFRVGNQPISRHFKLRLATVKLKFY
jgi:hypothetical protein